MRLDTPEKNTKTANKFITMIRKFSREFPRDVLFVILINAWLGVTR
ncbi:hypothetical protein [Burkholderia anthina]|nr:hypothetical protein [Burkholderia anthina]